MKAKVLVVDDSPFALKIISSKLSLLENAEIITAPSGEAAIALLKTHIPDIILTDNNMEGMSGVELCKYLKESRDYRAIFICILTAEKMEMAHKIEGLSLGADDYLFKDIPVEEFIAKVKSFIRISHLQKELQETIEIRNKYFSFIVHELRTPLTAILGYLQFCRYPGTTPESMNNYLGKIDKNSRRILETVNNILEISRLEAGAVAVIPSHFVLSEAIHEVMEEQVILAQQKGLKVINQCESIPLFQDKNIIKTVLTNFMNNSIKYSQMGTITFWSKQIDDQVLIGVTDEGIGISREFLPNVFDSFSRENNSLSKVVGTGIGMSLCKRLIDALNGEISADSTGSQKGSTFSFKILKSLQKSGESHS